MDSDIHLPSPSPQAKTNGKARQLTSHYSNICLFCNDAKIKLQGLILASQHQNDFEQDNPIVDSTSGNTPMRQHAVSDVMSCNCCQIQFADRDEQLIHYRCDWHRYNLHLRLKGLKCVLEEEFEFISGDVSSISGSEEDSECENVELNKKSAIPLDDTPTDEKQETSVREKRFDKIFFKNDKGELLSIYKCLFSHKKSPVKSSSDILATASELLNQPKWAVLMVSAGHFAGAIFNGKEVVEHKTFHRYTVRAKRGSAQSSRDGQGNAPKSAGASLRRHNEAALSQEVQELMKSWQSSLNSCSLIFVRIPMGNRGMFYGGKNPVLKKDDLRIRIVPFPTRRPTLNEVKRVQQMLSCIECYGQESDVKDFIPLSPPRFYCKDTDQLEIRPSVPRLKPAKGKEKTDKSSKDIVLKQEPTVEEESEERDFELYPPQQGNHLEEFETCVEKKRWKKKPKPAKSKVANPLDTSQKNEEDEALTALRNSIFTACKTGSVENLRKTISDLHIYFNARSHSEEMKTDGNFSEHPEKTRQDINPQDSSTPEQVGVEEATVDDANQSVSVERVSDFISCTFGDTANTLLHYATQECYCDIISILLHEGADPSIKNKNGKVPYVIGDTEAKNAYRRFMALFPDKYDYKQAQIPSPLTPEMEASKKHKNAERRAVKKKSMQERTKVKKAEELKQKEENDLKKRFLNLSDREKRALAAERRILQQHNDQSGAKPVLSRCYQCGEDMTGKVPFEYSDYKFCTTKCLREHRAKLKS